MKKITFFVAVMMLVIPQFSTAQYAISPLLIERTVEARDRLQESIKVTNTTNTKLRLYATVNEIVLGSDNEIKEFISPMMTDRSITVTSWIEIGRGRIEINPNETARLPLNINVNPDAKPGNYYAFIGLATGENRPAAEQKVMAGLSPGVVLRLTIPDTTSEQLQLTYFGSERFVINNQTRTVTYEVTNTGDTPINPRGEIIFYDMRGREVAAAPINTEQTTVAPAATVTFTSSIPETISLGKHKAFMNLSYGENMTATIYDTLFFTVVPIPWLIGLFALLVTIALLLVYLYHRRLVTHHQHTPDTESVPLFVRDSSNATPYDHDINLKQ